MSSGDDMRILVVEDEADLASAVAAGLRREGYAVDVAADGASALERIATAPYDVVCLDLNLPDLDGLEVCRRVVLEARPRSRRRLGRPAPHPDAHRPRHGRGSHRRPRRGGRRLPREAVLARRAGGPRAGAHPARHRGHQRRAQLGRPRARRGPPRGPPPRPGRRADGQGVRPPALVPAPPPGGAQRRAAAGARVGRERRSLHQHRAGDDQQPAAEAGAWPATATSRSRRCPGGATACGCRREGAAAAPGHAGPPGRRDDGAGARRHRPGRRRRLPGGEPLRPDARAAHRDQARAGRRQRGPRAHRERPVGRRPPPTKRGATPCCGSWPSWVWPSCPPPASPGSWQAACSARSSG